MIEPRFSRAQVREACVQLMRENRMEEAYVRPIVYIAEGAMGVFTPDTLFTLRSSRGAGGLISDKARWRAASGSRSPPGLGTTST